jgi:putative redox protein
MPSELLIQANHMGAMKVVGGTPDYSVTMDYPLAPGQEITGLTPLQLLLLSLAGCSANSMMFLLTKKLKQTITGLSVRAHGFRRDEHPTVITSIDLQFTIHGKSVDSNAVEIALQQSEDLICPVWAMLKPGTPISSSFIVA